MIWQRTIGIDLALEGAHQAVICNGGGQILNPRGFRFTTDLEEMNKLLKEFIPQEMDPKQVAIIMEPTGNAWVLVSAWFISKGYRVFVIKTQKVHALRKFFKRHAKTDRVDARTLAKMPFVDTEGLNELFFSGANYFSLERSIKARETVVSEISDYKRRVYAFLQLLNPKLMALFGEDRFTRVARAFYRRYANPLKVLKEPFKKFETYLDKKAFGTPQPKLIKALFDTSMAIARFHQSTREQDENHQLPYEMDPIQMLIGDYLDIIEFLEKKQKKLEKQITELHQAIDPEKILKDLKGFGGDIISAAILAFTGSIKRFSRIGDYLGYIGLVPRTNQSVGPAKEGMKITKAGKKLLKKYYYMAAEVARRFDVEFAHKYKELMQRGLHHNQAICALANMLARRVYCLLKQKQHALDEGNLLQMKSIHYQLRDLQHKRISAEEARQICQRDYPGKKEQARQLKQKKEKAALALGSGQSH